MSTRKHKSKKRAEKHRQSTSSYINKRRRRGHGTKKRARGTRRRGTRRRGRAKGNHTEEVLKKLSSLETKMLYNWGTQSNPKYRSEENKKRANILQNKREKYILGIGKLKTLIQNKNPSQRIGPFLTELIGKRKSRGRSLKK